ncbi:ATP-binding protein [Terasakiella sp. SH-1]|uniref:ATP-binding protein n=1 Tax=Terasakiella sp. SH-1 TaxID=2560057 RepID=UPI001073E70F|nr:ATP-binding protein [Terasakiella sp. SH-1]
MQQRTIHTKFLLYLLPPVIFATVLVSVIFGYYTAENIRQEIEEKNRKLTSSMAVSLAMPLWNFDYESIQRTLETIVLDQDISGAQIVDADGVEIARNGEVRDDRSELSSRTDIVFDNGKKIHTLGHLLITFNDKRTDEALIRQLTHDALQLIALLIVMIGAALLANRHLVGKPLARFLKIIQASENDNTTIKVDLFSDDEIGRVVKAYNRMVDQLAHEQGLLRSANDSLAVSSDAISRLLNSSDQGFLSFGADLIVEPNYSRACEKMFAMPPAGKLISELLFSKEECGDGTAEFFADTIKRAMGEKDRFKRSLMVNLLVKERALHGRIIEIKYNILGTGRVMLILSDISDERKLQEKLDTNRKRLEMIVNVATERETFLDLLDDFNEFIYVGVPELYRAMNKPEKLNKELYRQVHTFKGLFAQFAFPTLADTLHDIESQMQLQERNDQVQGEALKLDVEAITDALRTDLEILTGALGSEVIMRDQGMNIILPEINELVDNMVGEHPFLSQNQNYNQLLALLSEIGQKDLRDLITPYSTSIYRVAQRLDKEVAEFEIEGEAVMVDPNRYRSFAKSLVHVFRNAVDHGLETLDERDELGKTPEGRITCEISRKNHKVTVVICDDGRGIDAGKLRRRLVKRNVLLDEQVKSLGDDEILTYIFADNISTTENITEISGRGVGLAAVKAETEKLGGRVSVETKIGEGTCFTFTIPDKILTGDSTSRGEMHA